MGGSALESKTSQEVRVEGEQGLEKGTGLSKGFRFTWGE